ncbi:MAG: hypothetical protein M3410_17740 [Acidobacteriota bacterium]|nr:hypothetical protein [Acidobacteriota bacterium]
MIAARRPTVAGAARSGACNQSDPGSSYLLRDHAPVLLEVRADEHDEPIGEVYIKQTARAESRHFGIQVGQHCYRLVLQVMLRQFGEEQLQVVEGNRGGRRLRIEGAGLPEGDLLQADQAWLNGLDLVRDGGDARACTVRRE